MVLLRDVFDLSAKEVGAQLELSEANVRQLHRRARQALERFDAGRLRLDDAASLRSREVLERFFAAVTVGDLRAAQALLADDAVLLSDGGGDPRRFCSSFAG